MCARADKGPDTGNLNDPQPGGFCSDALLNIDPNNPTAAPPEPFYPTYCTKAGKACMARPLSVSVLFVSLGKESLHWRGAHVAQFSESGGAWHVDDTGTANQVGMLSAWCVARVLPSQSMAAVLKNEKRTRAGGTTASSIALFSTPTTASK